MTLGLVALAATALASTATAPAARAQTADTSCGDLVARYDEAIKTADGLVSTAVEQVLGATNPSEILKQLGIAGQSLSPEQAARRGAISALPPTTQGAIAIYLMRADAAMQAMIWKDCPPPGSN
jgi:hypothetical protein